MHSPSIHGRVLNLSDSEHRRIEAFENVTRSNANAGFAGISVSEEPSRMGRSSARPAGIVYGIERWGFLGWWPKCHGRDLASEFPQAILCDLANRSGGNLLVAALLCLDRRFTDEAVEWSVKVRVLACTAGQDAGRRPCDKHMTKDVFGLETARAAGH